MGANERVSILLVDDQPSRLLTYESVLAELGQNLVCARSGLEALDRIMRHEFAVVLLDVSMPDMDGFEVARLIHEHPRFEKTPIIFVTGVHVSELDRLKGYKLGAVDYVAIPVVPEILRSKVAVLVELYLKRRELVELNRTLALANAQLAEANTTLQAEKTRELEAVNVHLQRANAELEQANRTLQSEVAERSRVEQALKEADRHKDEFLAMLAHELRNPLAPILNAVQLMRMRPMPDPQLTWSREVIARQLGHLTRLVDDLLDVSRITRGKINLSRESVDLAVLASRAVETVQPMISEREHALSVELPKEPVRVYGDPLRLTQALGNVLGNAAKYTDRGGRIGLIARQVGAEAEVRITDTGIGIPSALLPNIFNMFTQVNAALDRPQSGLGIGLSLVRRLLEMHGGSIAAYSEGDGQGSEFVIRLPVLMEPAAALRSASAPEITTEEDTVGNEAESVGVSAGEPPARRRRILVADDNSDALESLATLLELGGHEVYSAANGALALESAERHLPEVALLDIGMPKLDGYEVARRIRAQPWGRRITLVALTGWGQDSDRRRSGEAGFDSHLVKPLDLDKLTALLHRLPVGEGGEGPGVQGGTSVA
ncbi:MAG TPA: response regulator [Steroidobacteraceae bacterium]|nr:response regulator [Steroidobacteraceae bacterium]